MVVGVLFFALANVFAWFQFNSQFVWEWWKDRPLVSAFVFAIPMSICFWYAIKNVVGASGELWTGRLMGFGVGTVVYAVLTYTIAKESMCTAKTLTCLTLAMIIIAIQIFWK